MPQAPKSARAKSRARPATAAVVASKRSRPADAALPDHSRGRAAARIAFTVLLVLLTAYLARDFLTPVAWAAVIAITVWPVYRRVAGSAPSPIVAPLVFTLLIAVVLVLPGALAVHRIAQESGRLGEMVGQLQQNGIPVPPWAAQVPLAGERVVGWWQSNLTDPKAAAEWLRGINTESLTAWTSALGAVVLHGLVLVLFALLALFFLLRDGAWIADRILDTADRLLGDPGEKLASKMVDAVRGTVNGTVVVAVVEGVLIGIGYVVAGVPSPFLFTLLTVAFAMLPFGAWAAFSVASLLLLAQGASGWLAAAVFGWGAAVMLIGDHFLFPALIGRAARLPFLLALIGIFGGLQTFGLLGLFIGPVIMAAALTIWREWLIARNPAGN